jgi:chorismate mutase
MAEAGTIPDELTDLRSSIDNLDASIILILSERFKMTKLVGKLKAKHKLAAADPEREEHQIIRLRQLAENAHLDPVFAERFLRFVIDEVIRHHQAASEQQGPAAD